MSRQLLLSGHTIRCDVGYGLAAGDGERVAVTPVAVSNAALGGVRLVVGDRCAGLVATVDSMPPKAGCRRCMVHFLRNVLSKVPPTHREWASAALKAVFAMESRESALDKAGTVAAEMEARRLTAAANRLREGIGGTTTCLLPGFPDGRRRRIRTNDMIERLNREIGRRTRVVESFPDGNGALMLCLFNRKWAV